MPQELQILKDRMRECDLIPSGTEVAAFLGFIFGSSDCQHCGSCSESCLSCVAGSSNGPSSS